MLSDALGNLVGWESALARTLKGLLADPGGLAGEYSAGRRKSFVPPARFCLLAIAAWFLATRALGLDAMDLAGIRLWSTSPGGDESEYFVRVREFLARNFDAFLYASLPLRALVLRLSFRRSRRNYAETLVLVLYLAGFGYLAGALAAPAVAAGWRGAIALHQGIAALWSVRAARTFFEVGWPGAAWRVALAIVVHTVAAVAAYFAVALAWVALTG